MITKVSIICLVLSLHFSADAQTQLWGTTHEGGVNGLGVIFMSDSTGNSFHTAYEFIPGVAKAPIGGLCLADNGSFYGVTGLNGFHHDSYCYTYNSSTENYSNLQDFFANAIDGWCAKSRLIKSDSGMLFGLCAMGGNGNANSFGIIYSVDPTTNTYSSIYIFDSINGAHPYGSLTQASNGKLYGIASGGGANNSGVIFCFNPSTITYNKLYDFPTPIGGFTYYGGLEQASNGKFYGATQFGGANNYGQIFSFDESTSTFTDLYDFDLTSGANPRSNLIQANDGNFYGLTYSGGLNNTGVLYRIDTNANYTKVLDFTGANGANPTRRLLQAKNGKLFGTTFYGGNNNDGVIFNYDIITNVFTKLIDFNTSVNGSYPDCEIIETPMLNLLGIDNISDEIGIRIYPNPFNFQTNINFAEEQHNTSIRITDILGKEIKKVNFSGRQLVIDKAQMNAGIYFVEIMDKKKKVTNIKIIIQ